MRRAKRKTRPGPAPRYRGHAGNQKEKPLRRGLDDEGRTGNPKEKTQGESHKRNRRENAAGENQRRNPRPAPGDNGNAGKPKGNTKGESKRRKSFAKHWTTKT